MAFNSTKYWSNKYKQNPIYTPSFGAYGGGGGGGSSSNSTTTVTKKMEGNYKGPTSWNISPTAAIIPKYEVPEFDEKALMGTRQKLMAGKASGLRRAAREQALIARARMGDDPMAAQRYRGIMAGLGTGLGEAGLASLREAHSIEAPKYAARVQGGLSEYQARANEAKRIADITNMGQVAKMQAEAAAYGQFLGLQSLNNNMISTNTQSSNSGGGGGNLRGSYIPPTIPMRLYGGRTPGGSGRTS